MPRSRRALMALLVAVSLLALAPAPTALAVPTGSPPVAVDDTYSVDVFTSLTVSPLDNDFDPDGGPLGLVSFGPSGGGFVFGPGPNDITFDGRAAGTYSFFYTINDVDGDQDSGAVTLVVAPTGSPPVAVDDTYSVDVFTSLTVSPLDNDFDPDGGPLGLVSFGPSGGGFVFGPGPNDITFDGRAAGTYSFFYTINDVDGDQDSGAVTLVVAPAPARLRVTTTPALPADISVDGLARDSWGLNWVEFPPGPHQVCFGEVAGYTKPACQDITMSAGTTSTVVGNYSQNGFLRVITSPALPSTISVNGVARNDWGLWTEAAPGTYNVCFGAVEDFDVPGCRDVVVTAGATATTTGTFSANPAAPGPGGSFGYLRATTSPAVGAMISIDGAPRDNWGLNWLKLAVGSYQVCFGEAPNVTKPGACNNITVTAGATTTVTGTYAPKGFLRVITSPSVPATITVEGQIANAYGVWTPKAPGTYDVCFGAVAGFVAPPCQNNVNVTAGATATVTGTYTP